MTFLSNRKNTKQVSGQQASILVKDNSNIGVG